MDKSICSWFTLWSLTQWSCLFIETIALSYVAASNVLHVWCQSWRCSRIQPCTSWEARYISSFCHRCKKNYSLLLFLHPWLFDNLSAVGFVSSFSLMTGLLWYDCTSCSNPVHRTLLVRSQTLDKHMFYPTATCLKQERHRAVAEVFSQFDQIHVAHILRKRNFILHRKSNYSSTIRNRWFLSSSLHLVGRHLEAFCQQLTQNPTQVFLVLLDCVWSSHHGKERNG